MTGYLNPTDLEPVESFQLTSHHVDVDVMYSTQVFQIFARRLTSPVVSTHQPHAIALGASGDSSDDDDDDDDDSEGDDEEDIKDEKYTKYVEFADDYTVVFFAATKELVRQWSVKILNWNRYVFSNTSSGDGFGDCNDEEDAQALQDAHEAVVQAFRASSVGELFSPRVRLHPLAISGSPSPSPPHSPQSSNVPTAPLPPPPSPATQTTTSVKGFESLEVSADKPPPLTEPPARPWWTLTSSSSRRIRSHSLRKTSDFPA